MPATFLSEAERLRYQRLPGSVPESTLRQHGYLSPADLDFVRAQRRDVNRLGCAVQLVVLRVCAHLPERWWLQVSAGLLDFVAAQLVLDTDTFAAYGRREATVYEHFQAVLQHLGWRRWQPLLDAPVLEHWLLERALEHDQERVLLELACQRLRQQQLVRPSVVELERLIGALVEQAHAETYRRLAPVLTPAVEAQLDALLRVDEATGRTRHSWLLQPPTRSTPTTIRATLDKRRFLQVLGADAWDLAALHPNRQKRLASLARHRSNQALQRLAPAKRYPLLLAFGREMLLELTDLVLKMADEYWETALARARREMEEYQRATTRAKDQVLATLGHAVGLLLDEEHVPLEHLRQQIYARVPRAYPRQHQLTTLLQEYGRLLKTNFILRYLQSQPLRRRIHAQLNKGEQLHALRSWLWFGGDGALRRQQDEQQQETVRCLNLLTNVVVVWNTIYMQEAVNQLRREGQAVGDEDLRFLSPARYRHINRLGRYSFLPATGHPTETGLRPLRPA